MADTRGTFSQDAKDASYTFNYLLDDGQGNTLSTSVNVSSGEASDLASALSVADAKAAAIKETWLNELVIAQQQSQVVGEVVLPLSAKALAAQATLAQKAQSLQEQPAQPLKVG